MKLDEFCTKLDEALSALSTGEARVETAVRYLCPAFSVTPEEVAFFRLDAKGEFLTFIWPPKLRTSGEIPLSAASPLVAQTARENSGFINNSFAATPHASFFELFRLGQASPLPIQKIISTPLCREGKVTGVVQVCRKAESVAAAGPDFSRNDLLVLQRLAAVIAQHI